MSGIVKPEVDVRYMVYLRALRSLESDSDAFICNAIREAYESFFEVEIDKDDDQKLLDMFPEFMDQKPEGASMNGGWFGSAHVDPEAHNKRIQVLKNAMAKAAKEIEKK